MPSSPLHSKLRRLVGQRFSYLSAQWLLIDVLAEEDQVVLQRDPRGRRHGLQSNQYGQAQRRVSETLCLPISAPDDSDGYSEELMLLLQGRR